MLPHETTIFLVGPTASGKTEIGLELASRLGAEILSLDSMQVYRGMDLGTAKLPLAQRRGIAHHLLDLREPSQSFSVAEYKKEAEKALAGIASRGKRALFVGGTHLYLKVMTHGLFEGPPVDEALRQELMDRASREGDAALHRELLAVDPVSAARIHPNDRKRVVRALEVFRLCGTPISALQTEWAQPKRGEAAYRIVGLRLAQDWLHERIGTRVREMFAQGFVEEVQRILNSGGFGPQSGQALGYREIVEHLRGERGLDETIELIVKKTRGFARRQMTWLRSFEELRWVDLDRGATPEQALQKLPLG